MSSLQMLHNLNSDETDRILNRNNNIINKNKLIDDILLYEESKLKSLSHLKLPNVIEEEEENNLLDYRKRKGFSDLREVEDQIQFEWKEGDEDECLNSTFGTWKYKVLKLEFNYIYLDIQYQNRLTKECIHISLLQDGLGLPVQGSILSAFHIFSVLGIIIGYYMSEKRCGTPHVNSWVITLSTKLHYLPIFIQIIMDNSESN